jgi:S1-C subfamily serine protease
MRVFGVVALLLFCMNLFSQEGDDSTSDLHKLDSKMMKSTFKIQVGNSVGTAFILLDPLPDKTNGTPVLITAAHVLQSGSGSNAVLHLRTRRGDAYGRVLFEIPVRANSTNLWTQHPEADVAAMRIPWTNAVELDGVPLERLADDSFIKDFVIHPGDELRVLGYPLGYEANEFGFPILRSGRIASYPLIPTAMTKTFLLDFRVFRGNSGGPVYIIDQRVLGKSLDSVNVFRIMGLISEEAAINEQVSSLTETTVKIHELGLGIVIHARAIKETIARLPPR